MKWSLLLGLAVAALYASAAPPLSFVYDDELLIAKELPPRSAKQVLRVFVEPHYGRLPYYRPLSRVTYLLQKSPSGDDPRPFRLFNAALAGLIVPLSFSLMRHARFDIAPVPALFAATLFVVHPAASSCVYPVVGRETLLATIFTIACCLAWLRGRPAVALLAFAAGLLSKEQAIVTPLLLLAAESPRGRLSRYVPFAAVVVAYLALRAWVLVGDGPSLAVVADPMGPLRSLLFAAQTAVAPFVGLAYEPAWPGWLSWPRLLAAGVVLGLLATRARAVPFWAAWFVLSLLPSANWVVQETRFDERYVFPALLGLFAGAATIAGSLRIKRQALGAAGIVIALAAAGLSFQRATWWADGLVFHERWVRSDADSPNAHNGLGVALANSGSTDAAIARYREALRLDDTHEQAHNNLALALSGSGRNDEARRHFDRALQLKPDYAEAHFNLANLHAAEDRLDDAESHYRLALDARPHYTKALNNYGVLLMRRGETEQAAARFAEVLRLDPRHARAHVNAGVLLARGGRFEEAIGHYRRAIEIDPDDADAYFDLAVAAERLGRRDEALRHYERALELARRAGKASLAETVEARLRRLGTF